MKNLLLALTLSTSLFAMDFNETPEQLNKRVEERIAFNRKMESKAALRQQEWSKKEQSLSTLEKIGYGATAVVLLPLALVLNSSTPTCFPANSVNAVQGK